MKKFGFSLWCSLAVFLVLPFTGCEVGLGEAVDTRPPELAVTYPKADSVIRESFVVEGTCKDETSMDKVVLTFSYQSDNSGDEYEFEAELNTSATAWRCTINTPDENGKYPLRDGLYNVKIVAYDKAGTTNDKSISYIIDNTAPLLILENPSTTISSSSPNKFGQTLKVVGRVADDNDIDMLKFDVYDENGEYIDSVTDTNVAQNMENTIGTYSEDESDDGIYSVIYGHELDGEKQYRFKVTISDEARVYKGTNSTSDPNERGNTTDCYYLYKDIATSMIKTYGLNTKQIYKILAGIYTDEITPSRGNSITNEEYIEALQTYAIRSVGYVEGESSETDAPLGTFSLNPSNNPYYTVSGIKEFSTQSYNFTEVSKSHIITINAYMGLSESPLDPDTFSSKLYKMDKYGKYLKEDGTTTTNMSEAAYVLLFDTKENTTDQDALTLRSQMLDEDNLQITIQFANFADYLDTNQHYQIVLEGKDEDGVDFSQTKQYCVLVKSSNEAPTLKVTVPSGSTINLKGGQDAVFKGTVTNPTTGLSWVYAYIVKSGKDSSGNDIDGLDDKEGTEVDTSKRIYAIGDNSTTEVISDDDTWTLTIPASSFDQYNSVQYQIKIFARESANEDSNSTSVDKYVYYDVTPPDVDITVSPIVEYENTDDGFVPGTKYLNSEIKVSGVASDDNGIASTVLHIYAGDTEDNLGLIDELDSSLVVAGTTNTENRPLYTIKTTDERINNKYVQFEFVSTDLSGNTTSTKTDDVYLVNQETDKPIIKFSNLDKNLSDVDEIQINNNLFDQTSNNKLLGVATDDDKIFSICAYYKKQGDAAYSTTPFFSKSSIDSSSYTVSIPLVKSNTAFDEGVYTIKIEVADTNAPSCSNTYEFVIAIDAGAPKLSITTDNNSYASEGQSFTISGKVQDSSGIVTLYTSSKSTYDPDEATQDVFASLENASTEQVWQKILEDIGSSGETLYIIARDKYGNYTSNEFTYKVDSNPPTKAPDFTDEQTGWLKSGTYLFRIPVSDEYNVNTGTVYTDASMVKQVSVEITNSETSATENLALGQMYNSAKYENKYTYYTLTKIFGDGIYSLVVKASDYAGNTGTIIEYPTFKIDATAPVVGSVTAKLGETEKSSLSGADINSLATVPFTLTTTISDATSGINKVELYDNSVLVDSANYTVTSNDGTYVITIKEAALTTGKHSFAVKATDNATNENSTASVNVTVDRDAPVVEVTSISPVVDKDGDIFVNSYMIVEGNATDETALGGSAKLAWQVQGTTLSGTVDLTTNTYSTWKTSNISTEALANGTYILLVTAEDSSGNVTNPATEYEFKVDHGTDKPVVTVTNADSQITYEQISAENNLFGTTTNNKLAITVTDDKKLSSSITVTTYAYNSDGTVGSVADEKTLTISQKASANTTYTLPEAEGKYKVVITVKDAEWTETYSSYHTNTEAVYNVAVDGGNPGFSFVTVSGAYKTDTVPMVITGKVSDSSGKVTVKRYNSSNDYTNSTNVKWSQEFDTSSGEQDWTDTVATDQINGSGGDYYYIAEDAYGNTTSLVFNYKIDKVAPTLAPDFTWDSVSSAWSNTTTYPFKIPVSDEWDKSSSQKISGASGIATVELDVNGVRSPASLGSVYQGAAGNQESYCEGTYFTYTTTQILEDGGSTTVKIIVTDAAGNVYTSGERIYKIDSGAPTFGTVVKNHDGITATQYNSYAGDNIFTVTLPVIEKLSGIKSITIDDNKTLLTKVDDITSDVAGYTISPAVAENTITGDAGQTYTIKFTKAAIETGQHAFNFNVTDMAGNIGTTTVTLSTDTNPPEVSVSGIKPVYNSSNNTVNGTITVSGVVTDDAKLASLEGTNPSYTAGPVKWELINSSSSVVDSGFISTVDGGVYASWSTEVDTTKFSDGTYTFKVTAKDAATNTNTASVNLIISQETDRPTLSLTSGSLDITSEALIIADTAEPKSNVFDKGAKLTGLIQDDDGISSVVVTVGDDETTIDLSSTKPTSYSLNHTLPETEGIYNVTIQVTDIVGNVTYGVLSKSFCIAVDSGSPVWTNFTPDNNGYYNSSIPVSATVTDGSGSISVTATTVPANVTSTHSSSAWTVAATEGTFTDTIACTQDNTNTGYTVVYTATDKWGRTSTKSVQFYYDNTAPLWQDANSGIGDNKTQTTVNAAWYKSEALTISGKLTESGSGVETIYYWVKRNYNDAITISSDVSGATGSFAASNADGVATYKAAIDGLEDYITNDVNNNNEASYAVLYLIAVDKAGNKAFYSYNVKVDTQAPDIAGGNTSTYLTNKVSPLTINGTCSDTQSGISGVTIKIGSTSIAETVTVNGSNWSVTIPADECETGNIYATAIDNAGNKTSVAVGSINVDITVPTVALSESITAYASSINGSKEVSGKVTESNPASLELWYNTANTPTTASTDELTTKGWVKFYQTSDAAEIYNFTTDNADGTTYSKLLDFDTVSGAKNNTNGQSTLYILPVVYDQAGNCSVHGTGTTQDFTALASFSVAFTVDMNGDRPVVKMNDLTDGSTTIRKYTTSITGMITDDDGITEFYISPDAITTQSEWDAYIATLTTTNAGVVYKTDLGAENGKILEWTSNGSFTYTPLNSDDGNHYLYFYVKDSNNNIFFTGKTAASGADVYRPYILYKGATINTDNTSVVTYQTDSNPPAIESPAYRTGKSTKTGTIIWSDYSDSLPSIINVGGSEYAYIQFRVTPTDALGISSVSGQLQTESLTFNDNDDDGVWISDPVFVGRYTDVTEYSGWTTNSSYSLMITATDVSQLTSNLTRTVAIDNNAPTVENLNPSSTTMKTGTFSISGTTTDTGVSGDVSTLKYWVINSDYSSYTDAQLITAMKAATQTMEENATPKQFSYNFDGTDNPAFPSTASALTKYSDYKIGDTDYYNIPVYFLAIDAFGNEYLKKDYTVYYNPYSDRPTVVLYTPGEGEELSGTIRVSGSAEDTNGGTVGSIDSVYIQIDINKDNEFDETDLAKLLDLGYTIHAVNGIYTDGSYSTYKDINLLETRATNTEADSSFWGIVCSGSTSWYASINSSQNLQLDDIQETSGTDTVYPLSVRAAAIDDTGVLGSWTDKVSFKINPNAPTFGSAVPPYITDGENSKDYSSLGTTYVNGVWSLVTSVEHSSGIKEVSYSLNNGSTVSIVENSVIKDTGKVSSITNGYQLTIPITGDSGEGVSNLTIYATEAGQGKNNNATYSVNYDNAAPTISSLNQNDEDWTEDSVLKNDNSALVIGSTVEDGTSGLNRVLFYFYRDGDGKGKRIFDVGMNCKDSDGNYIETFTSGGKTYPGLNVDALTGTEETGTSYMEVNGNNLYGYRATGLTRASETSISGVPENIHIRTGSVVYIGNSYHKITSATTTAGVMTLTISPSCTTTETTAFFPYAMSVDNFNRETVKKFTTETQTITNDDGDGMPESIGGLATSRTWTAQLHANWMPDGPITFVMFAFDGAENVTSKTITCKLETSAPRLAKIHFGTDLNKNEGFTDNEFETYNFLTVEGAYQDAFALTTKSYNEVIGGESTASTRDAFKIKDKLAVIPEFTGGNGEIYLVFNNADTTTTLDTEGYIETAGYTSSTTAGTTTAGTLNSTQGTVSGLGSYYQINSNQLGTASTNDTDYKKMSFTFWDSTDGLVAGSTSQKCFLSVRDFLVKTTDTVNPNAVVDKFFWNGTGDGNNSLYQGSKDNGHIELEGDLTDEIKELYGDDPKVSGKIVIRGSAYDDSFLNSLAFTMTDFNSAASNTIATYSNGTWTLSTNTISASPYYEVLSVEDEYFSQDGHKVNWAVAIDTARIASVAKENVTFTVTATDNASLTSTSRAASESTLDSEKHRPSYQMDVVPYIGTIKTELSDGNKKRPSVINRSALGYYPVRRGSSLTINGFNLNGTSSKVDIGTSTDLTPEDTSTENSLVVTVDSETTFMTGDIVVKIGDIQSLNNMSAKSVTSDSGTRIIEYNTEPNDQNNALLTDERRVKVVDVYTTTDKEDKRMLDMAISGNTINFSAGYKDAYFSVMMGANGTSVGTISNLRNSYTRYFDNAIAVNESGTPFTVSACGDTYGTPVKEWGNGPSQFALTKGTNGPAWEYNRISNNTSLLVLDSNWNGADLNNLDRFKWPAITVTGTNAATKGYISYYDSTQKLIKFRYFTSTTNTVASNLASYRNGSTATQYVEGAVNTNETYSQGYTAIAGANENSAYSAVGVTSDGAAVVTWYDASNGTLKMKYNTNPAGSFSGFQAFKTVPTAGTVNFKISVDGGTAKDVSVTFANPTYGDAKHEFAYQLNLVLSNGYGAYAEVNPKSNLVTVYSMQTGTTSSVSITGLSSGAVNNAVAGAGVTWNEVTIDEDSAGQYVAMKTDSKGGIHFAYYDTGNGDLKYAYMSSVSTTPVVVTVDGYQQVGQYVDIAVREGVTIDGISCIVPYISYYSMSNADTTRSVKVAKLVKPLIPITGTATITSATASDPGSSGSFDELFTGTWEAFHVPTAGIPVQYRVNIGVTSGGNVYVSYLADRIIEYVKVE